MDKKLKHGLHCCSFVVFTVLAFYVSVKFLGLFKTPAEKQEFLTQSYFHSILLLLRIISAWITSIYPVMSIIGLLFYNCFDDDVITQSLPKEIPRICFRTVTRGNFPNLVRRNVERNRETCLLAGLRNFIIEIVTDKYIDILESKHIKQTVVPLSYIPRSGALFKGRALQYALEINNSVLDDEDWIVHLDEETLLTERSVDGIINFVTEDKYPLGQGMIMYANEDVVNWLTTFLDFWRVAEDLGRLRLQLKGFHKLITEWKGSFVVCKVRVEKDISFDHGVAGSITEDTIFGLMAASKGYKFDFIRGEMWEKSPFTLKDLLEQRRRWLQGGYFVARTSLLPFKHKILPVCVYYGTLLTISLAILFGSIQLFFPWNLQYLYEIPFAASTVIYMYSTIFGAVKSYSLYNKYGRKWLIFCIIASIPITFINLILFSISFMYAIVSKKLKFHITEKEYEKLPVLKRSINVC